MKVIALFCLGVLAGCQTDIDARSCQGSAYGLNPGRWQPAPGDLKVCQQIKRVGR